jgi:hypothetical protein
MALTPILAEVPVGAAQAGLGIGIGEMQFGSGEAAILLLAVAAALSSSFSLWRIAKTEDRQTRLFNALRRTPHRLEEPLPAPQVPWHQRFGVLVLCRPTPRLPIAPRRARGKCCRPTG